MNTTPKPLRILVVGDERPGHVNQSEAIVMALRRRHQTPHSVRRHTIVHRWRHRLARRILAHTASLTLASLPILGEIRGMMKSTSADLVISTGGDTLALNALLTEANNCTNVFVGSLRGVSPNLFKCVLHIDPKFTFARNHWVGLKPAPIDPDAAMPSQKGKTTKHGVILLGGPTVEEPLTLENISKGLRAIADFALASGIQGVNVYTSRRTPSAWTAAVHSTKGLGTIFQAKSTHFDVLRSDLLSSEWAVVTGDSSSMITEAIYARKRTLVLCTSDDRSDQDGGYLVMLEDKRLITRCVAGELSSATVGDALQSSVPLTSNPLDLLASALEKHGVV